MFVKDEPSLEQPTTFHQNGWNMVDLYALQLAITPAPGYFSFFSRTTYHFCLKLGQVVNSPPAFTKTVEICLTWCKPLTLTLAPTIWEISRIFLGLKMH